MNNVLAHLKIHQINHSNLQSYDIALIKLGSDWSSESGEKGDRHIIEIRIVIRK